MPDVEQHELHPDDVELKFNSVSDRVTYAVETPDGSGIMCMISGYDLKTVFNLQLINSLEDAEAMANAIADVFYQNLVEQLLEENKTLPAPDSQH